jgi:hypothetical protein
MIEGYGIYAGICFLTKNNLFSIEVKFWSGMVLNICSSPNILFPNDSDENYVLDTKL